MANLNSENLHVGRKFQEFVQTILKEKYNTYFEQEAAIPIGRPPKEHKFDLANADRSIVAECKCYTWTDSGNVPSAKLMGLDEAVFYFGFLPSISFFLRRILIALSLNVLPFCTMSSRTASVREMSAFSISIVL